ncbi:MAG TPA: UDP-N-acetylmuramoyl-L-alanine--D-glutamate ligase [Fibrobacteria bacterium]|nr:UDP-N-acetylmuramoyl-L-alanine--D-glutamate ligase [Fibrobacteria bacterium]
MIQEQAQPEIEPPIGVLGYGVEGASTCRYLLDRGFADITVFDRKQPTHLDPRLRYAAAPGSGDYLAGLAGMRTVFRSAGVRPDLPALAAFIRNGGVLTSQTGLAFALAGRERIIGVTGTVGKGTCCSLLHAMLEEAEIPAGLGGNIGVPALDLASSLPPGGKLILELSSFQLSTLAQSPALAAVLRTTTEHLDWHPTRDEYWLHKANLAAHQAPGDALAYCADAEGSAWIAGRSPARKTAYGSSGSFGTGGAASEVVIDDKEARWTGLKFAVPLAATRLKGRFNLENIAAAGILALEAGAEPRHVVAAAMAFRGLEHRLEFVRDRNGVSFYNDSYATRPEATLGAVQALREAPLGLILGGSEKHADFSELASAIAAAGHVRAIALIGQTADRLREELASAGFADASAGFPDASGARTLRQCPSLETAVEFLMAEIGKGAIALSPACASFGMFENYKERGKAFKKLVAGI